MEGKLPWEEAQNKQKQLLPRMRRASGGRGRGRHRSLRNATSVSEFPNQEQRNNDTNVSVHSRSIKNTLLLFVPSALLPAVNCAGILGVLGYKAAAAR